jgi:hypothetical protein
MEVPPMVANPPKADPASTIGADEVPEPGVEPIIQQWLRNEAIRTDERVRAEMDQDVHKTKH